jgi:heat shock protein HtpX
MGLGLRVAMVLVGLGVLVVSGLAAVGLGLVVLWLFRGATALTVAVLVVVTLLVAYLNYRAGPTRVALGLETVELSRARAPAVHRRLERLCAEMELAVPPVLVADLGAPNALSVGGPRRGVVVLDGRLLELLTVDELEGILAHELAHLEGYDAFVQTLAVSLLRALAGVAGLVLLPVLVFAYGLSRAVAWLRGRPGSRASVGEWLRLGAQVAVAGLLSLLTLGVLAYSRRREFTADARAATVTGKPQALARALWKIRRAADRSRGLRSLLYTHTGDERAGPGRWLSTHPPVEERIRRLTGAAEPARHG